LKQNEAVLRNVIIIGGGLSGLISSIIIARAGIPCLVIEKKSYPLHRVCGEYISNEAAPFLKSLGLYPDQFSPPQINRLQLSSVTGRQAEIKLKLGGFGISRFSFDHFLYQKAKESGVDFILNTEVQEVTFENDTFFVKTELKNFEARMVIGAYGKRSKLDVKLGRSFIKKKSPYAGIKYHIRTDHPEDLISLHNFKGGYCGMSNVDGGKTNLCYLTHSDHLRHYRDIKKMEEEILFSNPLLKSIFANSDFIFDKPEVINEISFATKTPVESHIPMAGDAAGMITPLCGNGMAMAIHAAKVLSTLVIEFSQNRISRAEFEANYALRWRKIFSQRLAKGRLIQRLFGSTLVSNMTVDLAIHSRPLAGLIVRNTHGKVF
jgi:menaquinone-9 beta-reductase